MLTDIEIEAIKKEAEELYPDVLIEERGVMELWEMHEHNDMQGYKRQAYITAATSYALRAKGMVDGLNKIIDLYPNTEANAIIALNDMRQAAFDVLNNYNQNKEV